MKKYTLFLLLISYASNAQIINFPDANFKNALVNTNCIDTNNNGIGDIDADANNDGEIEVSEAVTVNSLIVEQQSIANLSGIEQFINLHTLNCSYNPLITLDLTSQSNLSYLNATSCQLTSIVVDGLTNLNAIYAGDNYFSTLDLSTTGFIDGMFGPNPNLEYLNIKNGVTSSCIMLLFGSNTCTIYDNCPALIYVCLDESELQLYFMPPMNQIGVLSSYCSFTPGGGYNTIVGNVTYDCGNQNEVLSNVKLNITDGVNSGSSFTNSLGYYMLFPNIGNHTVTPQMENPNYFQITPTSVNFTFSTTGNNQTANFCVSPNGVHPDLELSLIPLTSARPGFNLSYKLVLKNKGTETQSGTVTLYYDDTILDYLTSNPTISTSNTGAISWNFTDLQPFESREYSAILNLNGPMETPAVNIGDVLPFTSSIATAETDETPSDNVFSFDQIVIGSYDPNDKTCLEGSEIAIADINKPLHYIIRFQNTGTAAAENVVVKDLLHSKLDLSSLQITSSSHLFRSTLTQGNKLEFFFENINLPASLVDEPASHGYIAFSIKPKSNVVVNDIITNDANIYFDYNYPIVTNTTSTTVRLLAIDNFELDHSFTVYPNPTHSILNVKMVENIAMNKVEIANTVGQTILSLNTTTIDISELQSGTYFITIFSENGKSTQKFIKL